MIEFLDPSRPQREGLPCWLETRHQLPDLYLSPRAEGRFQASLVLPTGGNSFRWYHVEVTEDQIPELLSDWRAGPEAALMKYWSAMPPQAQQSPQLSLPFETTHRAEDLGL